jgi:hypothetical protein
MTTPVEREHDRWARQYLCAVLQHDTEGLINLLTDVNPRSAWDRIDAVGAAARDVLTAVAAVDVACTVLSQRLVRDALAASASPGGEVVD